MFNFVARKIFGSRNERILKRLKHNIAKINALEPAIAALDDAALSAKTQEFKDRLDKGETTDQILPEAFAVVREAAKRILGERHYDVQMLGGMVLHEGKIPEMRTGEGKTLVSTLPVYLNAISGKGVHVVTVNDYLAKRDAEWMGRVYRALGLSVGIIQQGMDDNARRAAYASDITYSTNNELGFDYLRDNMKYEGKELVQRPFHYAIIDEVDSILIDEARTPLIISGPAEDSGEMYRLVNDIVLKLVEEDKAGARTPTPENALNGPYIEVDEKTKSVLMSDAGVERMEELLREGNLLQTGGLYDAHNMPLVHHTNMALKAHKGFQKDKEYIVKSGKIVIIDEFTGRMMEGRRFSDGLHQALEAKEKVEVQRENQTLASITFQNFFRMYPKFAGMTGTALTEANEFAEIYNLDVVEVPTHRDLARKDYDDEIYRTAAEKNRSIVALVKEAHARRQPVLVGTTSIEKSEQLSELFKRERIPHNILNARHHEQEASIVAQAGRPGAVTVATNMAGRGTDIKLGGNAEMMVQTSLKGTETPEEIEALHSRMRQQVDADKDIVKNAGGLYVIGTERHESRRIDNQLRGRSGRQGDPGTSKFFISLEDDLMRIFGAERIDAMLQRLGIQEGQSITHRWISTAIERAQKKVEAQHFDIRRNLLRFDNVMNDQRKVIYDQRKKLMNQDSVSELISEIIEDTVLRSVERHIPENSYKERWDLEGLTADLKTITSMDLPLTEWANEEGADEQEFAEKIMTQVNALWAKKQADFIQSIEQHPTAYNLAEDSALGQRTQFALTLFTEMERNVILQLLDKAWKEHLLNLDHLRQGINLRGYAQRDPLNEYKSEAFSMFKAMLDDYRADVAQTVLNLTVTTSEDLQRLQPPKRTPVEMQESRVDPAAAVVLPEAMGEGNVVGFDKGRQAFAAAPVKKTAFDQNDPSTWADNVARNAPCPCGSGKKYKHCHGAMSAKA